MANQPNNHNQILEPLQHEPNEFVMNVYPIPGTDIAPDYRSQDVMGKYLMDRFKPEAEPLVRVVLEATGRTLPGIARVPTGDKEVTRIRKTDEWAVRPRTAVAIVLGSLVIFNGLGNADTIEGAAKLVGHDVYRLFDPVHDTKKPTTETIRTPGKVVDLHAEASVASTDVTGAKISLRPGEIQSLGQRVKVLKDKGGKVLSMTVTGETSNDWGAKGDGAFGQPNVENQQLGRQIARTAYGDVKSELAAAGLGNVPIKFGQHETVLSKSEAKSLTAEAKADDYDSLESAVKAVDRGQLKQGTLFNRVRSFLTSKRGESIDIKVAVPGEAKTHVMHGTETIHNVDHKPHVPKPDFYWFIPMLPFKKRERYQTMKQTKRWEFVPAMEIPTLRFIRREADKAWLRVRPDAVKENGTLVDNSWAYTRKYEHLLRDDRIKEVLRADFTNAKDEEKSLRIMFVDEAPKQETVDVFSGLLKKFAAMDGGKIADRVSAMFVYPSENAGTGHKKPKRIAMGVDKQSHENVLGTYTYILDLVELHMPTQVDTQELEAVLGQFNGPAWVLAHETAGHGTDDSDEKLRLRPVVAHGIPNAHVIDGDPRALKMAPLQKMLTKLPRRGRSKSTPIEFDISYPVLDNNGQTVTMTARVKEDDSRLAHATHSTIVGYQPTQYAGTNPSEHYAETAASVTTGIAVPYSEAEVAVAGLKTDAGQRAVFANGYRPDARGQQLFTQSVGSATSIYPVSFRNPSAVTISSMTAEEDPLLNQELNRTRRMQTLTPREMVAILARSTRSKRS